MKLFLFLFLVSLRAFAQAPTAYTLDPTASILTWTGHAQAGDYAPSGTLRLREGRLSGPAAAPTAARVVLDLTTIAHENAQLAEHLRNADFFDVAQFPTAVFELTRWRNGQAEGRLTLKGRTLPVKFPLTVSPQADGRVRLRGTATLDRTTVGLNYNSASFFQNLGSYAIRNDFQLAFDLLTLAPR